MAPLIYLSDQRLHPLSFGLFRPALLPPGCHADWDQSLISVDVVRPNGRDLLLKRQRLTRVLQDTHGVGEGTKELVHMRINFGPSRS
jgi:hypothetical protein